MSTPSLQDDKQAGTDRFAENDPGAAAKLHPRPKLFLASEGDNIVDGLEINQDPLPLIGTHADRHLG
jgi:hypothetical protein